MITSTAQARNFKKISGKGAIAIAVAFATVGVGTVPAFGAEHGHQGQKPGNRGHEGGHGYRSGGGHSYGYSYGAAYGYPPPVYVPPPVYYPGYYPGYPASPGISLFVPLNIRF